ncbi:MAG: hypothetical protein COA96_10515 [SAR86 cluster bacterium]|uniref:PEP-CTERM sorting domain-containing protein n=1 Tax=SAR86 cluster bacterium TaxID=2030880 RepID=A0A2A5AXK7_9GAMM|nr:MAG: hypothetical protein COA96_10515 [SAR86 cluster bacterium]
MMKIRFLLFPALLLLSINSFAGVIVNFDAKVSHFNPGPLVRNTEFSGSFTIDNTVVPSSGGNKYFYGALDNVVITIDGQTFGGTDGNYLQHTSSNGELGYIGATLSSTVGSQFGSYNDGIKNWEFVGLGIDWRGLSAELFPSANPALIGSGFGRSDDGILSNNEIDYALMSLRFKDENGVLSNALRVSFSSIEYVGQSVPEPAALVLLMPSLLILLFTRKSKIKIKNKKL